jgi:phage FluMu protein Com
MGLFSRNNFKEELDKQKKENMNLLSNINFLINLILEQELKNEVVKCPVCKNIDNIKIDIQITNTGVLQEKVFNGKIECLRCDTSTLIKNKKTIQDVKYAIEKWIMSESEIIKAYHIAINELVKSINTQGVSGLNLRPEYKNSIKLSKGLGKNIEDVIRDIKEKQKQTDRR